EAKPVENVRDVRRRDAGLLDGLLDAPERQKDAGVHPDPDPKEARGGRVELRFVTVPARVAESVDVTVTPGSILDRLPMLRLSLASLFGGDSSFERVGRTHEEFLGNLLVAGAL